MKTSRCVVRLSPRHLLEALESRTLLSVAAPIVPLPAGAAAPPAILLPSPLPPITITPPVIINVTSIGLTIHPVAGVPFAGDVGELKGLAASTLPRLKATIFWGDSAAATPGVLSFDSAGLLHVAGAHTYAKAGTYAISISVVLNPPPGTTIPSVLYTINSQAVVTRNSAGGVTITPTVKVPFTGVVGTFSLPFASPLPGGTTTGASPVKFILTASIAWGDGTTSVGAVKLNADGSYGVVGTHTYNTVGTFRIMVSVFQQCPPPTPITNSKLPPTPVPPIMVLLDRIYSTAIVSAPRPIITV